MKVTAKEITITNHDGSWFQTFPAYGRYPVGGSVPGASPDAVYVFDEEVAQSIVANFHAARENLAGWPGILVDREHFSCDPDKTSDAMAWATDIRVNEDGSIWTKWKFTPEGQRLWDDKVLVSRSPCFDCVADDDDVKKAREFRAYQLISIGMTNTPHFKTLSPLAAAKSAAEANTKENENMEKIIEALGLQPGATEDEVLAALAALKDKASAAENHAAECEERCKKCEGECRALKAEQFLKDHAEQIADAAKCREVYMKDPELAEAMLASCKAAPAPAAQQVLATAKAKTPADASARIAARDKAVADYRAAHGCDFTTAWGACRDTHPELFAD